MPGSNLKEIHAVMKQMLDFRFLRVVTRADSLTVNDVRLAEEAKRIADTDLVTLVNTKSTARGGVCKFSFSSFHHFLRYRYTETSSRGQLL